MHQTGLVLHTIYTEQQHTRRTHTIEMPTHIKIFREFVNCFAALITIIKFRNNTGQQFVNNFPI